MWIGKSNKINKARYIGKPVAYITIVPVGVRPAA